MRVKVFQSQFAPLVEAGIKLQTIRPVPKRVCDIPKVGDELSCREWTGKPYRSKQRELCRGVVLEVSKVTIFQDGLTSPFYEGQLDDFAKADGFGGWNEMVEWFKNEHGLPFTGILIKWKKNGL